MLRSTTSASGINESCDVLPASHQWRSHDDLREFNFQHRGPKQVGAYSSANELATAIEACIMKSKPTKGLVEALSSQVETGIVSEKTLALLLFEYNPSYRAVEWLQMRAAAGSYLMVHPELVLSLCVLAQSKYDLRYNIILTPPDATGGSADYYHAACSFNKRGTFQTTPPIFANSASDAKVSAQLDMLMRVAELEYINPQMRLSPTSKTVRRPVDPRFSRDWVADLEGLCLDKLRISPRYSSLSEQSGLPLKPFEPNICQASITIGAKEVSAHGIAWSDEAAKQRSAIALRKALADQMHLPPLPPLSGKQGNLDTQNSLQVLNNLSRDNLFCEPARIFAVRPYKRKEESMLIPWGVLICLDYPGKPEPIVRFNTNAPKSKAEQEAAGRVVSALTKLGPEGIVTAHLKRK